MAINYGKLNAKLTPRGSLKATMGVSGPLNSDYEALINKPQINGNELIGDKSNADLGIPTALEDLTDDSTHRVVTDEQISTWNNKSDFSGSYNDLTDKPTIPDELADLTDDSTHRLVTDTEKTTWNAKSDFSGSYNDLTDVPTNLVQDANYVHTDNNYDDTAKGKVNALGTASTKNVPVSGDASTSEVVLGNDTRLTDDRNAKDVYSWAKASTKPSYTATEVGAIASTLKGTANGVAELDANGKVPSAQLPSYVDDVLEYASTSAFPQTGESGKIYIALDTNKTYRWSGTTYTEISESLALGETDSTAYAGNKGKQNADNIATIQGLIPSSAATSNKLATANDIPDISGKADKSEMSVSTSNDLTTIQLKSGTSATVINAHQDISGKANKSEMSVSTSGDKTTIQLKSGTSAEVLNQHQDISGKVDKVQGKGLSTNDYDDTAKSIVDGVTSALADKVDKVNGKGLSTEDYTTAEKTKLGAISSEANKVTSSSTNGHINIDGVDTTVYDDTSVQIDIEDIQDELSTDSATVQGNPINFSTLTSQNAESTIIDLEPIQDLHGYPNPWVGGAGKNLIHLTISELKSVNTDGTWSDNVYTNGGLTYTILTDNDGNVTGLNIYGTASYSVFFYLGRIDNLLGSLALSGCPSGGSDNTYRLDIRYVDSGNVIAEDYGNGKSVTFVESTNIRAIIRVQSGYFINNKIFTPQLEVGSSPTSFAPYENICAITGRTQIGILGCGVNLFDKNAVLRGYYINSAGEEISDNSWAISDYMPTYTSLTYAGIGTIGNSPMACYYDKAKNVISTFKPSGANTVITPPNNAKYIRFSIYLNDTGLNEFRLYAGSVLSEISTYLPYTQSNDITINLGDTIYGCQIKVEEGQMVINKKIKDLGDLNWAYWQYQGVGGLFVTYDFNSVAKVDANTIPISSDYEGKLPSADNQTAYNKGNGTCSFRYPTFDRFYVRDDRYTDPAVFKTALIGVQLCYDLASPITVNLTPHTINLLKGVNNISVDDANATITLTYRDGSVATLGDLTSAVDSLDGKIEDSKILTDTVTGDKYILVVTNGVLDIQQVSN